MLVGKVYQKRKWKGEFHCLIKEMKLHNHALFFTYFRMSPAKYEHLFAKVAPYRSVLREGIPFVQVKG